MDRSYHTTQLQRMQKRFFLAMMGLVGMGVINFILVVMLAVSDEPPVVLVPSNLSQEARVGTEAISDNYIADYAYEVALIFMNTTASNLSFRRDAILKLTHPNAHGKLSAELDTEAARIKRTKSSTSFWISRVEVSDHKRQPSAVVVGQLQVMLGKTLTSKKPLAIEVVFERDQRGTLLVQAVNKKEIKDA